jgi:hypothetical protein
MMPGYAAGLVPYQAVGNDGVIVFSLVKKEQTDPIGWPGFMKVEFTFALEGELVLGLRKFLTEREGATFGLVELRDPYEVRIIRDDGPYWRFS